MGIETKRIKFGHPPGQKPSHVFSDFDWIHDHEKELLEKYGECSIIVYKEQVIGVGDTWEESVEDAERNLPPEIDEIVPIQHWLVHHNPFLRVQPTPKKKKEQVSE